MTLTERDLTNSNELIARDEGMHKDFFEKRESGYRSACTGENSKMSKLELAKDF